jgi:hypothetical protein
LALLRGLVMTPMPGMEALAMIRGRRRRRMHCLTRAQRRRHAFGRSGMRDLLEGFLDADPTIAAIIVGAVVVAAVAFVVMRVRAGRRRG